jgi:hypothetical protein
MPKINTWMAMGRWSSLALGVSSLEDAGHRWVMITVKFLNA